MSKSVLIVEKDTGLIGELREALSGRGFDVEDTTDGKGAPELIRKTQPYAKRIAHKGIWVEPKLLAEIEYRAKSAEGKVRHPFFRGLREDL